jgi:hypothetical protein
MLGLGKALALGRAFQGLRARMSSSGIGQVVEQSLPPRRVVPQPSLVPLPAELLERIECEAPPAVRPSGVHRHTLGEGELVETYPVPAEAGERAEVLAAGCAVVARRLVTPESPPAPPTTCSGSSPLLGPGPRALRVGRDLDVEPDRREERAGERRISRRVARRTAVSWSLPAPATSAT